MNKIISTDQFFRTIKKIKVPPNARFYLRGEARYQIDEHSLRRLEPSVFRDKDLETNEASLLSEFFTRQPTASGRQNSAFSQLVFAQHYKLPTRLLDISRNPLVALFNAIEKNKTWDGCVHLFVVPKSQIKSHDSDTISILSNFTKLTFDEQKALVTKKSLTTREDAIRRLYHFIKSEKPHFQEKIVPQDLFQSFVVEPRRDFERLKAQSGAFFISALHKDHDPKTVKDIAKHVPTCSHRRLVIAREFKEDIKEELKLLNISHETLYPGFESTSHAIKQEFAPS